MDFEYDVFISYTHLDNEPLSKKQEGWISSFHYSLNVRLAQLLGPKTIIWRDNKLDGNDVFSDEIIAKLHKTKVLLTVISPGYLQSKWCMKELDLFLEDAEKSNIGDRIGNKSRIFKVIKTYVPYGQHPAAIRGSNGYEFCELDEKDNIIEFNQEEGSEYKMKFYKRLNEVAGDICKLIKEMDQPNEGKEQQPENPPKKTVYLAETTSDLREEWENIRSELEQNHYTVLPDRSLPYQFKEGNFRETVQEYLNRCKLSVHLIGNRYALIPEEEEQSIVELQNQLAAELCQNDQLTRLIRIPPDIDKNTKSYRQKEYITVLRNDAPQVKRTELLETGLEEFKTHIQDTLAKLNKPPEEEITIDGESPLIKRVYLVCDQQDVKDVKPVKKCLLSKKLEVMLPLFKGTELQRHKIHNDRLSCCDAMMIYYDHGDEYWLESNLNELRKAPGHRGTKPLVASAIYVTGEKTEHKEEFDTLEAQVIKCYVPFSCDFLDSFVSKLHGSKGGGA